MKVISKFIIILLLLIIVSLSYLSFFGIETDRFNSQILNKIKNIDKNIEVELKKIRLVLDPFSLKLNVKTVGSKIKKQNKVIEIENIKTQISLKSIINNKFSIQNLEISTKSLEIKNLISFIRSFENSAELFILEKTVDKGYLIADIKVEFDSEGKIKNNFVIDGFIKDAKLSFLKKYNIQNLDLIFDYQENDLMLSDISFSLNDLNFLSDKILLKKLNNNFIVEGNTNHKSINIDDKNLDLLIKPFFSKLDLKTLEFSSDNSFKFEISKKFEINNFEIKSEMLINELSTINNLNLKDFFPNVKKDILFSDSKLSILYKKDNFNINGKGNILFQDEKDNLEFSINNKNGVINFKSLLKIQNNPFLIDYLNYEKDEKSEIYINYEGKQNLKKETLIKKFSLIEGKNKIELKNLIFNKKFEITKLESIKLDYIDKENEKNLLNFEKKKNSYHLKGTYFNANKLIDDLLFEEKKNSKIFNINSNIAVDIEKIKLDNKYNLSSLVGDMTFKNNEIVKTNLTGNFADNKRLKFTINTKQDNKITTLFIDNAEPIVSRYKFIKGFEEGSLDFYSSKQFGESVSQLKIYDFKLKELPVLTKILTLASLQGIADILSGEGIRFEEFEMKFRNKGNLMTIDEIYAIGPAISVLMEGYVEKDKIISLRGTLVPATTINKFIGSLPVLGKILVGSKTGEGVFGVSFKIKGPPNKLETSVNPIKTLTPRFITRTLEKIKKN
tara:strand:- start:171 stop:2357 length:2187 start_codon:yes stop_codon:yes gene_type:complete